MIVIYMAVKDLQEANRISRFLLEKRLVACTNSFPIDCMYLWEGQVQEGREYAILCKTVDGLYPRVEKEIKKLHSYEIPAIYSWKVDRANPDYLGWVEKEIKKEK
jgi:periplasmic divalent cation tolerance protein